MDVGHHSGARLLVDNIWHLVSNPRGNCHRFSGSGIERMATTFGIVDLFAGPGGLAEGFSKVKRKDGSHPFKIELSVEMEASAHQTLLLRSFLRQFDDDDYPQSYFDALNAGRSLPDWSEAGYRSQWGAANREAIRLELARDEEAKAAIDQRIRLFKRQYDGNLGLIGGPPCQAYSLVGRSRNRGNPGYVPELDKRHYLYKEYIRILTNLEPVFFVMENVRGILSSRVDNRNVFDRILYDLGSVRTVSGESYLLTPIAAQAERRLMPAFVPADFIVRSERFGIPQARHRVIVLGIRSDIAGGLETDRIARGLLNDALRKPTVWTVLESMPPLRSSVSRGDCSPERWLRVMQEVYGLIGSIVDNCEDLRLNEVFRRTRDDFNRRAPFLSTRSYSAEPASLMSDVQLRNWLTNDRLRSFPNHETRSHMPSDLARYLFAAMFAEAHAGSPKAHEYPSALAPEHANWHTGKFTDRFRVQQKDRPASTITSHVAKDGHYFIHPDPVQCRSLTVREAARLQTFPDDYLFRGNRTQQYTQVGNAVPPLLAKQIGDALIQLIEPSAQLDAATH